MIKDFCIYYHRDLSGNVIYVYKGTGRRAWSTDRHAAWVKDVRERLGENFTVEIYKDGLTKPEAEELESELIGDLGEKLVNKA